VGFSPLLKKRPKKNMIEEQNKSIGVGFSPAKQGFEGREL
jgi:hypothetical protein